MTDEEIQERAEAEAHDMSPACKNRPKAIAHGHGAACTKMAKRIAILMREARDSANT